MAKVIRVFGKADAFDIEFSRKGEKWTVDIPPDMTDGVYAVQLTAVDSVGESAYWVGELYMVDGVCCLKINELPYKMRLKPPKYETEFQFRSFDVSCSSSFYSTGLEKKHSVQIKKGDCRKSSYSVEFSTNTKTSEVSEKYTLTVSAKETEIKPKTEIQTDLIPKTKILIGKGCCCYANK